MADDAIKIAMRKAWDKCELCGTPADPASRGHRQIGAEAVRIPLMLSLLPAFVLGFSVRGLLDHYAPDHGDTATVADKQLASVDPDRRARWFIRMADDQRCVSDPMNMDRSDGHLSAYGAHCEWTAGGPRNCPDLPHEGPCAVWREINKEEP